VEKGHAHLPEAALKASLICCSLLLPLAQRCLLILKGSAGSGESFVVSSALTSSTLTVSVVSGEAVVTITRGATRITEADRPRLLTNYRRVARRLIRGLSSRTRYRSRSSQLPSKLFRRLSASTAPRSRAGRYHSRAMAISPRPPWKRTRERKTG